MLEALQMELNIRKGEHEESIIETIYFGGGTPSLFSADELRLLLDSISQNYKLTSDPEITIEANPDDLSKQYLHDLKSIGINRLSIGIQSFEEEELKMMNRAHDSYMARKCLDESVELFNNISIDLIYGIPGSTDASWQRNIETSLGYDVPHISAYALTVEPKTALASFVDKGLVKLKEEQEVEEQFFYLLARLEGLGYVNYEISNFGKPGYFSKNNSAYWQGIPYLGIGPSAHSFDGENRSWNVRNNSLYIKALASGELNREVEWLSNIDRFNEMIMTGLRTIWGVRLEAIKKEFGDDFYDYLIATSEPYIKEQLLYIDDEKLLISRGGKFLVDGIAAHLFKVNST